MSPHFPPPFKSLLNVAILIFIDSNETSLTPIPFNASRSDLDIALELALRPSVSFVASVGALDVGGSVALTVGLDIPKLDVDIRQVHNVTSTCDAASQAQLSDNTNSNIYDNLTLIAPSLGFDVFEVFNESFSLPGVDLHGQQPFMQNFSAGLPTACLAFDAARKTLVPAAEAKGVSKSAAVGERDVGSFRVVLIAACTVGWIVAGM